MGERGPVPKRSSERRRRNKESEPEVVTLDAQPVVVPPADESWHPIAHDWYTSLAESGQAQFFEPSDWQAARYVAHSMSLNLQAGRFSAQLFSFVWSAMSDLLTTEASRRRVRLEIEREGVQKPAEVTSIAAFRARAGA